MGAEDLHVLDHVMYQKHKLQQLLCEYKEDRISQLNGHVTTTLPDLYDLLGLLGINQTTTLHLIAMSKRSYVTKMVDVALM
jgi:hypothetical protein